MKRVLSLLLLIVFGMGPAYGLDSPTKRTSPQKMTVSIIVPCHYVHVRLIPELLERISAQSALPDEVVISVSEAGELQENVIREIEQQKRSFVVKIIQSDQKLTAGQNRNVACTHAAGDLLICQDADDIPHPQRIEIIKSVFENYKIDHLMHFWILPQDVFENYDVRNIADYVKQSNNYETSVNYYEEIPNYGHVTNGNIAMTRSVFEKVQWPPIASGEDQAFNRSVYDRFKNTVVAEIPLLIYRNQYSSFHSSSYPYVTGDTFRAFADFIIDEVHLPFFPANVKPGNTIFVKTEYLGSFFRNHHLRIPNPYILITHNSPLPIPGRFAPFLNEDKLLAWFGVNVDYEKHPKLHPIPVGLPNQTYSRSVMALIEDARKMPIKNTVLYASLQDGLEMHLLHLADAKFALIAPQEALDCHEVWEALYMGAIPIIQSSVKNPVYKGLPVEAIDDWNQVTESWLEKKYRPITTDRAELNAEYWFKMIQFYKNGVL